MTWRYVGGFAVGTSHRESNTPCQDRCACSVTTSRDGGDVLLVVVSDGAGSAAYSERGAQLVCDALLGLVGQDVAESSDLDQIADERVRSWFLQVRELLRALARETQREIRDYAATALVAVASERQTLCARIGDGGIVLRRAAEDPFEVALWPESGEYANQTYFITDDSAPERIAIARFDEIQDLVAFSDGLQHLALERATRSAFEPFFIPLVTTVRQSAESSGVLQESLVAYLNSTTVNERTDDDKSVVIGCRLENCATRRSSADGS